MRLYERNQGFFVSPLFFCLLLSAVAGKGQVNLQIGQNFTATSYGDYNTNSGAIPPDCNGVVGSNYFVEFVNGMFTVYSKTNGDRKSVV